MTASNTIEKLLWLDMEMTGLVPEKEVPIEIAASVTNWKFEVLDQYHAIIRQPNRFLEGMDDWNKKHHGQSGLLEKIPGGKAPETVDIEMYSFVRKNFGQEKAVLAGNSIGQDRAFIRLYMQKFEGTLNYRMLDVSAWKIVFNNLYDKKYSKKQAHRAQDDILESIEELKFYLAHVKPSSEG
jgi:oligoribonuclease